MISSIILSPDGCTISISASHSFTWKNSGDVSSIFYQLSTSDPITILEAYPSFKHGYFHQIQLCKPNFSAVKVIEELIESLHSVGQHVLQDHKYQAPDLILLQGSKIYTFLGRQWSNTHRLSCPNNDHVALSNVHSCMNYCLFPGAYLRTSKGKTELHFYLLSQLALTKS